MGQLIDKVKYRKENRAFEDRRLADQAAERVRQKEKQQREYDRLHPVLSADQVQRNEIHKRDRAAWNLALAKASVLPATHGGYLSHGSSFGSDEYDLAVGFAMRQMFGRQRCRCEYCEGR